MVSWRSFLPAILLLLLGLPPMASADMWRCALPDGGDIYTNNPKDYQGCQIYEPVAELSVFFPVRDAGVTPRLLQEPAQQPEPTRQVDESPVSGNMPFEVWRMLTVGMHETQVLEQAGPPTYISGVPGVYPGSGLFAPVSNALRYNYVGDVGDWIVVVEFDPSGRVRNVERFRQRLEK
jgi:hypothetical protein